MWGKNKSHSSSHKESTEMPSDFLAEESSFLDCICNTLSKVNENVYGLLSDLSTQPTALSLGPDLDNLQRETYFMKQNIEAMVGSLYGDKEAMEEIQTEVEEVRNKYKTLQQEWDDQQEHLGRMQSELYKLRNQLQHQSQFCASLGAVMGNLVWKSSRNPAVVDLLLKGNKIGEFLCIASGTLVSFLDTYRTNMPNPNADESQFITAMCGIVTNLAASPSGRQFLVTNVNGVDLIEQFIKTLPKIPTPSGNCLKRLILMALYNICINKSGLEILQRTKAVLQAITHSLQNDTTRELKLMSLRLLLSITYELDNVALLKNIYETVPLEMVTCMSQATETDVKIVAKEILDNLDRAQKIADMTTDINSSGGPCNTNAPFDDCYYTKTGADEQMQY